MRSIRGSAKGWANARRRKTKPRPIQTERFFFCYEERDALLLSLGFKNYSDYLGSAEWRLIREEVLKFHPDCILCEAPAVQVHHLAYDARTLTGVWNGRLVQLCRRCHEHIEFGRKGRKNTLDGANSKLLRLALTGEFDRGRRWAIGVLRDRLLQHLLKPLKKSILKANRILESNRQKGKDATD